MARIHGRNGRLYVGLASASATAEPVTFLNKWSIAFTTDDIDVSALGDSNRVYVSGMPDVSGSIAGWFDDATVQTYTAAVDGAARRFYLYPDNTTTTRYWYGTAVFDFQVTGGVAEAVAISGDFKAASAVTKIG